MAASINVVFLIGNGFDLAAGLNTSAANFIKELDIKNEFLYVKFALFRKLNRPL